MAQSPSAISGIAKHHSTTKKNHAKDVAFFYPLII